MQPTSPAFVPASATVAAATSASSRRALGSRSAAHGKSTSTGTSKGATIVAGPVLYDPAPTIDARSGGGGRDRTTTSGSRRPATVPSSSAPGLLGQEPQPPNQRSRPGYGQQQRQPLAQPPPQPAQDPRQIRESRAELKAKESTNAIVQDILREIKGLQMGFAQSLESSPPWAPLAEDQRKAIRRQYLTLLYGYPREADLSTFDQHWMQTTHSVIAKYRALPSMKAAATDPVAAAAAVVASSKSSSAKSGRNRSGGARKEEIVASSDPRPVLKAFAHFLKAEIQQYLELVIRLAISSGLDEVQDVLDWLCEKASLDPVGVAADEPFEPDQRQRKFGMFVKGLIFLGDLERYREMYSPERLGLVGSDRSSKRGGGKTGTASKANKSAAQPQPPVRYPIAAKFEEAREYYDAARRIQPENGNPFNQVATIDNYLGNQFDSIYHFLRALAVKESFVTARGNVQAILKKPLKAHLASSATADRPTTPKSIETDVAVLLAMLVLRTGFDEDFVEATLLRLRNLICDQALSHYTIIRTLVSLCAVHWDARLARPSPRPSEARAQAKVDAELRTLETILGFITVLYDTAFRALAGTLSRRQQATLEGDAAVLDLGEGATSEPAGNTSKISSRHLTVVLLRSLPALRVAAKWIRAHQDYLSRVIHRQEPGSAVAARACNMFTAHVQLANALALAFPAADLCPLEAPLEEDFELRGFGPLRKFFPGRGGEAHSANGREDEEAFVRISDLQLESLLLASMETSCVYIDGGRFALVPAATPEALITKAVDPETDARAPSSAAAPFALGQVPQSAVNGGGDELKIAAAVTPAEDHASPRATAEVTYVPATHASSADVSDELKFADMDLEDDPVDAAMRAALADSDEGFDSDAEAQLGMTMSMHGWGEVEERILWPPASARKAAAAQAAQPPSPDEPPVRQGGITAQDLLQQLGSGATLNDSRDHVQSVHSTAPSPGLFGGVPLAGSNGRSGSIWGSSLEKQHVDPFPRTHTLAPAIWGAQASGATSPSSGFGLSLTDSWAHSSASGTLGSLGGLGNGGFGNGSGRHYSPAGQSHQSFDTVHLQQPIQHGAYAQYSVPRNSVPGIPGSPYGLPSSSFATPGLAAHQSQSGQAGPPFTDGLRSPWG